MAMLIMKMFVQISCLVRMRGLWGKEFHVVTLTAGISFLPRVIRPFCVVVYWIFLMNHEKTIEKAITFPEKAFKLRKLLSIYNA